MAEKDIKIKSTTKALDNEKNTAYETELAALQAQKKKAEASALKARQENENNSATEDKIFKALDKIRGLIKKK